jgi:hypothetical protein
MRGMKKFGLAAAGLFIATALGGTALDAHAVRYDNIEVTVTPGTTSLSYGKSGLYTFYIANKTNGNINSIRFRARLTAGEFALSNPINLGAVATCTRPEPTVLDCAINGGLTPSQFSTFDFQFTAPSSGSSVALTWNVRFGQGDSEKFIQSTTGNPQDISLITNSTTEANAYIPPGGDNVSTGNNFVPTTSDLFTVYVYANPVANRIVTASISEQATPCLFGTLVSSCAKLSVRKKVGTNDEGEPLTELAVYNSDETLTDLAGRLEIKLRVASGPVAGKKINFASIWYTEDDSTTANQLLACPKRDPLYIPGPDDAPCIASRIEYTKRTAPSPDLIGVWEFTLYAAKNGFIDLGL